MKPFLVIFLTLNCSVLTAQINAKTYLEHIESGYNYCIDNNEVCPISIQVEFKLKNLKSSEGNKTIFVIPPQVKNYKIATLTVIKPERYSVSTSTMLNYGNHNQTVYDSDFQYHLPFSKDEAYRLSQGYNGNISHQGKNQLDFTMPIGTKIRAARGGVVMKVVDVYNKNCTQPNCKKYNNYIYIYHDDGTIAEYVHIKRKGSKVSVGDTVKIGQYIADSGNVGWSTGPHLHFSVFLQRLDGKQEFIKTQFKIDEDNKSQLLKEGESYAKTYN